MSTYEMVGHQNSLSTTKPSIYEGEADGIQMLPMRLDPNSSCSIYEDVDNELANSPILPQDDVNHDDAAVEPKKGLSSTTATAFNLLNSIIGVMLLSVPWAVRRGGLMSLATLGLVCIGATYTGKLIVRCFELLPKDVKKSYQSLGMAAFGVKGYVRHY